MHSRNIKGLVLGGLALQTMLISPGCAKDESPDAPASGGGGGTMTSGAPGELPIVTAPGDVPYQFGANAYGVMGGAFLAKAPMGSDTVVLDTSQAGKICLKGTVEAVPVPPDGSHPPYSSYWGIELGFNLNQGDDGAKMPWLVPEGVTGVSFTVEGSIIPPIRLKVTPTGKDPAQEEDSCALVTPMQGVKSEVLFSSMYVQCWNGPEGTAATDVSMGLVDMGLQIAASTDMPYPIDFCVTQVGVITATP